MSINMPPMRSRSRIALVFAAIAFTAFIIAYPIFFARSVTATSSTILISEFRTRGPAGANDEFVEIYNASNAPINIGGWRINRSNGSGTINTQVTITAGTSIPARGHFLITNSAAGGYSGAVPGNQTYAVGITDDGGIAVLDAANVIIDQVGMSAGSAYKEGATPLSQLTTNTNRSHERKPGGANGSATDTDVNSADFQLITPSDPQNLSSAPTPGGGNQAIAPSCPASLSTTQGTATSTGVSATDPDGTVTSALITSAAVPGITLDNFVAAAAVGGTATATLNVANTTGLGTFNVTIQYANNDSPTPQTATCTVTVNVTAAPTPTPTPSPTPVPGSVVISQVYGGGGNVGSTFRNDFVEIVNHTGAPINLSGWSVQIASAGQNNWQRTNLTNHVLQPGQYYLVQQSQGAGGTENLPTPDAVGGGLVGSTAGKIALVSNQTTLTTNCPVGGGIIDFVGYGTETCAEGSPVPALSNTTAALRKNNGCFDTNNNLNDFNIDVPSPRNTSSPTTNCNVLAGIGSANPAVVQPGGNTTLTVVVAPPTDPPSSGITVTADLSSIGGSPTQAFSGVGNTFTFAATVHPATVGGLKTLPVAIADAQARTASTSILLTVEAPHVTISQLYGGGGNGGATFQNDFVELFNPTLQTFDLTGWSLQYTSAAGDGWEFTRQPVGGTIAPGEYLLIALASGGATGAALPPANIIGEINMSATTGKVALVSNFDPLVGTCPLGDGDIVDFVGYGTGATCAETANAAAPSNTSAIFRKNGGATDTHHNLNDFDVAVPSPRRTAPIVEIGPAVFGSDPRNNGSNAPRDASISVNFTEPVNVVGQWFNISCVTTGLHNDATVAGANKFYIITPNVNFLAGEQCTITVFKDQVNDVDLDDSGPNTDNLLANYTATFTVSSGTAPAYPPSVHLTFGNPNGATVDINQPNNYLMEKPEFTLAYNRDLGRPNWVSWHLADEWIGTLERIDTFRPDPAVPPDWYRVQTTDFTNSGFDRGHMVPNADRDKETSFPINQATFLMTNILAQSPDNNQGPWADFENFLRGLLPANEVYVVAGPLGVGGTGSNGSANTIADGKITVASSTWKVVLVIPKGDNDLSRVTAGTRTIAIHIPNIQGIRNNPWETYLTTVDNVETLTGYNFFSNLPDAIENSIEAGTNGVNPPGTANQAVTTSEDNSQSVTLTAVSPNPSASFSFTIVTPPANGTLSGSGANRSYQPGPDFNGTDSFTFKANDGANDSNTSTVTITVTEVNDAPSATDDSASTDEDVNLDITASSLTTNDSAGPLNENLQVLTVTSVSATADTHGTVSLSSGTITYSPAAGFNGPASFTYQVCDNGTTNGAPDSQCTTGTVNVTVGAVNDAPTLNAIPNQTVFVGNTLTFTAVGSDSDLPAQTLTYSLTGSVPAGATINPTTGAFSWTPTAAQGGEIYTLTVRVTDNGTPNLFAEQSFTVGVAYTWSNLLAPVQAGGTYKIGRTIPIKFRLTGASAGVTNAEIHLLIFKVNDNVLGDPIDVDAAGNSNDGNLFRFEGGEYIFNWKASGLTAGTYQLQVDMGDGVLRAVNISLR